MTIYDDDICPDCMEPDGRCVCYDEVICGNCSMPNCPGYCDDYQTYNLRPGETGGEPAPEEG